ncbi:hypothetical protein AC249_AIPGENE10126 [Exaiptasia diaphana]|nr:hypothetical protein AC249_AIPGENE10126 [Exaiptasia diaphana]
MWQGTVKETIQEVRSLEYQQSNQTMDKYLSQYLQINHPVLHCVFFFQSEINTSLHHSYASLDKKVSSIGSTFPVHGRLRM